MSSETEMSFSTRMEFAARSNFDRTRGFSLLELMVAITLGILISIGLVILFGSTSKSNRMQDGMAQMQENGRYALTRINADLRMAAHQTISMTGYSSTSDVNATVTPNGAVNPVNAAMVYVDSIPPSNVGGIFPDFGAALGPASVGYPAATPWPLSPRYFFQGYTCPGGTCSPAVPTAATGGPPNAGTANNARVANADVLTVRYLNSNGWGMFKGELTPLPATCTGASGLTSLTVTPSPIGGDPLNFKSNDLAMLVSGSSAYIFQVSIAGNVLTPINVLGGMIIPCIASTTPQNSILYNFTRDFITVTYYVGMEANPNAAGTFIPSLHRRLGINDGTTAVNDQELVQGVEALNFLYGIEQQTTAGATTSSSVSYFNAAQVAGAPSANCADPPFPLTVQEAGCAWRSVKSIEAHILIDSISNMFDMTASEMSYRYDGAFGYNGAFAYDGAAALPTTQVSGLPFGRMMRREFVTLASMHNYNP